LAHLMQILAAHLRFISFDSVVLKDLPLKKKEI
jgi:hypothetical protein